MKRISIILLLTLAASSMQAQRIKGSDTVLPVAQQTAERFMALNPDARVTVTGGGTGVGISLAANKVRGIRAAVCSEPVTAALCRHHNDAQIIAFGARIVGLEMAKAIIDAFLNADFDGGRHAPRIERIMDIERRETEG